MGDVEHYYVENPKCKKAVYRLKGKFLGVSIDLITMSGMYSPRKIDYGSIVHLKFARIKPKDKVLDLGCGYGTVGILVKKLYPQTNVTLTDINKRAVDCAKQNILKNKVNATVVQGDCFKGVKCGNFDVILLNPPINAGLKICYRLIAESFDCLKLGGSLQIVIRPRGAGKNLVRKMCSVFGNASRIGSEGIYEVYLAKKESSEPASTYDMKKFEKRHE